MPNRGGLEEFRYKFKAGGDYPHYTPDKGCFFESYCNGFESEYGDVLIIIHEKWPRPAIVRRQMPKIKSLVFYGDFDSWDTDGYIQMCNGSLSYLKNTEHKYVFCVVAPSLESLIEDKNFKAFNVENAKEVILDIRFSFEIFVLRKKDYLQI